MGPPRRTPATRTGREVGRPRVGGALEPVPRGSAGRCVSTRPRHGRRYARFFGDPDAGSLRAVLDALGLAWGRRSRRSSTASTASTSATWPAGTARCRRSCVLRRRARRPAALGRGHRARGLSPGARGFVGRPTKLATRALSAPASAAAGRSRHFRVDDRAGQLGVSAVKRPGPALVRAPSRPPARRARSSPAARFVRSPARRARGARSRPPVSREGHRFAPQPGEPPAQLVDLRPLVRLELPASRRPPPRGGALPAVAAIRWSPVVTHHPRGEGDVGRDVRLGVDDPAA